MRTSQPTSQPTAPLAPQSATASEARPRRRSASLAAKLGETSAVVFALAVAAGLWYLGAVFTLLALAAIGIPSLISASGAG